GGCMGPRSCPAEEGQNGGRPVPDLMGRDRCCRPNDRVQLVRQSRPLGNPMSLLSFFEWCENSGVGEAIRNSTWLFPVIESFHLLALAVIGGAILVVDLRLFGLGLRGQPVAKLALDAQRWLIGSLVVMLISGSLLFTSEAIKCYYHAAFWVKMTSLLLAIVF